MTGYSSIGVVGAGAWGTALASVLAKAGIDVSLWAREQEVVDHINAHHENSVFLPGIALASSLSASTDINALKQAQALLLVVPAQFTRAVCKDIAASKAISSDIPLILCAKGIEDSTGLLVSEVVEQELTGHTLAVLSGPSFAEEVANHQPAALTLACRNMQVADKLVDAFSSTALSLYLIDDIIGAQIGGAVKNVLAIACGIAAGMKLGDNVHAALIALGLKEMGRLAEVKGGRRETLLELCGTGDTVLTCSSLQSRNMSLGYALGEGKPLQTILDERQSVTEGVASAKSIYDLSVTLAIPMPLCHAVYRILHEGAAADEVVSLLEKSI